MRNILFLIITALIAYGCSNGNEELKVETSIWYIAKSTASHNNTLTAEFFFFKDGDYDPTTFQCKNNIQFPWESGEITTISGNKTKSFYSDIVLKDSETMGIYNCTPGNYYIVVTIGSGINMQWKAKHITVLENQVTRLEAIFKDINIVGYTEWKE